MKLRLVSIPYTGTRFVRRVLVDNGHTPDEQVHTFVKADWHRWFTGYTTT